VTEQSTEDRIRARAHQIWEEEGRPEGRSDEHWERAKIEVGLQDKQPESPTPPETTATEPGETVTNRGEFLSDQGEQRPPGQPS